MNRKLLIRLVTFLGGIYFFLEFFLPAEIAGVKFNAYHEEITTGFQLIAAMALGLGLINILFIHVPKVTFLKKDWAFSSALLIGLFLMMFFALGEWISSVNKLKPANEIAELALFAEHLTEHDSQKSRDALVETAKENLNLSQEILQYQPVDAEQKVYYANLLTKYNDGKAKLLGALAQDSFDLKVISQQLEFVSVALRKVLLLQHETSFISNLYQLFFNGLFISLNAAMFSLLAFYVASAAYRAFRIKTLESSLMMFAAVLVILGQIPFGIWLWDEFPAIRLWLLEVPNSAVFRAVTLGVGVASLVMGLRMWLSIESDFSGEKH